MLQRNLLYTAVMRGKRLVVVVDQKKAMAIAVKGKQTARRWPKLGEWLVQAARSNALRFAGRFSHGGRHDVLAGRLRSEGIGARRAPRGDSSTAERCGGKDSRAQHLVRKNVTDMIDTIGGTADQI
jgi:hypothetical protein